VAHREICSVVKCPQKTHARLKDIESGKRVDVCVVHAILTKQRYKERAVLVEEWGLPSVFDENGNIIISRVHMESAEEATAKEAATRMVEDARSQQQ
jgi:hypothetical protein